MKQFNRVIEALGTVQKLSGSGTRVRVLMSSLIEDGTQNKYAILASGTTMPVLGETGFAKGCKFFDLNGVAGAIEYTNEGDHTSCDFVASGSIPAASVTPAMLVETATATATADGLTTGSITALSAFKKFVGVTSASATNAITLPGIIAATIGQEIYLSVGANGYELLTPASSGVLINQVDGDGTNQLDVAANTTVRCTQVTATAWLAETIAATTIAVTAPDND